MRLRRLKTWFLAGALLCSGQSALAQSFPLDPLTAKETEAAVSVLKSAGKVSADSRFAVLTLQEPSKTSVLSFKKGDPLNRQAFAVVLDKKRNICYEGIVNVTERKISSWREVKGVQPGVLVEEFTQAPSIARKDPRIIAAMKKRGLEKMDEIQIDAWAAGYRTPADATSRRLIRCIFFHRGKTHNPYPQPIEGVMATVDLNKGEVIDVIDTGVRPVLPANGDLSEANLAPLREAPKPLNISQPDGVSFKVNGREVVWQKWHFRFAMHPREGLVLYQVGYEDGGKIRPILYRACLSEMVVPYGDPDPTWTFRNAFDVGEYGVGRLADSLERQKDVPQNAALFDATFSDDLGKPYVQPNCVAIYERYGGVLWKHFDFETGVQETRESRQLVLTMTATVGNYDYSYNWIFGQDGSLEFATCLTGVDLAKGVDNAYCDGKNCGPAEAHGTLIAPHVVAPNHQHWFNMRMDFDVDGTENSVGEVNVKSDPAGPENPYGNGFRAFETFLKTEGEAQRDMSLADARVWMVNNPNTKNPLGQNPAYMLCPMVNSVPYALPDSPVRKRAGFIDHHFWATQYNPLEMYGGGDYPNQRAGDDGVSVYAQDNQSLTNKDVVVWYSFGVTHIPRPEDYPVMPTVAAGFKLMPFGFFGKNPALDVPNTPTDAEGR